MHRSCESTAVNLRLETRISGVKEDPVSEGDMSFHAYLHTSGTGHAPRCWMEIRFRWLPLDWMPHQGTPVPKGVQFAPMHTDSAPTLANNDAYTTMGRESLLTKEETY